MIGNGGREHLGLVFQAAEGTGVDHTVAVTLEIAAERVRELGEAPPSAPVVRESQSPQRRTRRRL